ncbi:MAG: 2-oxoacid:acceptor oxidoreductase family protein [Candidatus Stahlbacteria bacterium]|nr:2-oxoacid:acceptor oxidoreductase family protein [Candidatus Stahlbacteria bacterium]
MRQEVIISGFGGQGSVKSGVLLANAAMLENKYCTHFPSYGAEMRGGTANCSVIISTDEIASPIINEPDTIIVMNEPSLTKFEPKLKSAGLLIYNSSLIHRKPSRTDIVIIPVPANEIAEKIGSIKCANMVLIGAFIGKTKAIEIKSIKSSLAIVFSKLDDRLANINITAIEEGIRIPIC